MCVITVPGVWKPSPSKDVWGGSEAKLNLQIVCGDFQILYRFAFSSLVPKIFFFFVSFLSLLQSLEYAELPGQKQLRIHLLLSVCCCSTAHRFRDNTRELHSPQKRALLAEPAPVALMCVQVFVFPLSPAVTAQAAASSASCGSPHLWDILGVMGIKMTTADAAKHPSPVVMCTT